MTGRVEARTVAVVKRETHRSNQAAMQLAGIAVELARLVDAGHGDAGRWLTMTVAHLRDCGPVEDEVDAVRARVAQKWLDAVRDQAPVFDRQSGNGHVERKP
ncbi:hypothetical protein AB0I34_06930 [Kribbella sp. NPDC050281]|uniref:hypothetical protein n=1 Tax=Kribbella sp. NPDC050281 TaxID=3155515 RepID=UPI00340719A2